MPADRIPLSALIVPALDQLVATLDALSGKLVVLGLAEWRHITPSAEVARAIIDALVAGDDSETRWAWGAVDVASLPAVPTGTEAVRDDAGWWATPLGRVLASSWARVEWDEPLGIDETCSILGIGRLRVYQLLKTGALTRVPAPTGGLRAGPVGQRLVTLGIPASDEPVTAEP